MRRITLSVLLAALFACSWSVGAEEEATFKNFNLTVGQLFTVPVTADENDILMDSLPKWMALNGTNMVGIPQIEDVLDDGRLTTLQFHLGGNTWANVVFNIKEENPCKYQNTLLFEVYMPKKYSQYNVKELADVIQDFATTMDVIPSNFRVFRAKYLDSWREETNEVISNLEDDAQDDQLVVAWKLGCGSIDDDDDYVNIVSVVSDNQHSFRVVQAFVNGNARDVSDGVKPVTEPPIARTTRHAGPQRIKSLESQKCTKGKICTIRIPPGTFGYGLDLTYTVHPIDHDNNFLETDNDEIRGIGFKTGDYQFRLEARDRTQQTASAPFNVKIEEDGEADYSYEFTIDKAFKHFNGIARVGFLEKVASVLPHKIDHLRVTSVHKGPRHNQTSIKLYSTEHGVKDTCDISGIRSLYKKLAYKNGNTNIKFEKEMGPIYHVRRVSLELFGRCNATDAGAKKDSSKTMNSGVESTHTPSVDKAEGESRLPLMILLGVVAILAIFCLIMVIYCCMFRKSGPKNKKKPLEYVTKGHPVVFPNEVAHDDDVQSVAIPMLVKDERPPLQPLLEGTTIENPLYRAPALGRASMSTDTTNLSRPAGNPNQRLPPPYVAP